MSGFSIIVTVFIFVATIIMSSRFFYILELKSFTNRLTKSLGLDILQLDFSFEQMVYFVSLPSNLHIIKSAKKEDISIECEYSALFFPQMVGIKVYIQKEQEYLMVSYLPIKDFRLPKLDQMLAQGKIDEKAYFKISTFKLMHQETLNDIAEEVYKQIWVGKRKESSSS